MVPTAARAALLRTLWWIRNFVSTTRLTPRFSDLRRMTKAQYLNAVRDIFDDKVVASQTYPSGTDKSVTGFSTEAAISAPSQQNVAQVMNAAEEVAEATSKVLTDLVFRARPRRRLVLTVPIASSTSTRAERFAARRATRSALT